VFRNMRAQELAPRRPREPWVEALAGADSAVAFQCAACVRCCVHVQH
jgi:hypothetical protein